MTGSETVRALTEQNERMRAEVVYLRGLMKPVLLPPPEWGLSASERTILAALISRPLVSRDDLLWHLYGSAGVEEPSSDVLPVMLSKLRLKLRPHDITVHNHAGVGWHLDEATRKRLKTEVMQSTEDRRMSATADFRKELVKIMPGYSWVVHKPTGELSLTATGTRSSGFNRLSTLQVVRWEDGGGVVTYEAKSAGFGARAAWAHTHTDGTLARALRGLQEHYEREENRFRGLAAALEVGRAEPRRREAAE